VRKCRGRPRQIDTILTHPGLLWLTRNEIERKRIGPRALVALTVSLQKARRELGGLRKFTAPSLSIVRMQNDCCPH
jgi:hypothetical protein